MDSVKIELIFDLAKDYISCSGCLRRQYGAIIISSEGLVVGSGSNKSPKHIENCNDKENYNCIRIQRNIPHGSQYELCASVHAEQNAILMAGSDCSGGVLFLVGQENGRLIDARPCNICLKLILQSGIEKIYCLNHDGTYHIIECKDLTFDDIIK